LTSAKYSSANDIAITQVGDYLNLDIVQQGRGHSATANLDGDYATVSITQQNNSATNVGGHTSTVNILGGSDNSITTLQTGDGDHESLITTRADRSGNTVDVYQDGADHTSWISIYSDDNNIDVNQTGNTSNRAYVIFSSNNNVGPTDFTLNQTGGDTYGTPGGSAAIISCGHVAGCTVTVDQ
jgi:hypothetical protein